MHQVDRPLVGGDHVVDEPVDDVLGPWVQRGQPLWGVREVLG
ncbi:hypothetical protein [Nonomuraea sp. B19D2]